MTDVGVHILAAGLFTVLGDIWEFAPVIKHNNNSFHPFFDTIDDEYVLRFSPVLRSCSGSFQLILFPRLPLTAFRINAINILINNSLVPF